MKESEIFKIAFSHCWCFSPTANYLLVENTNKGKK